MRSSLGLLIAIFALSLGGITFLLLSKTPEAPELTIKQTAIFLEKNPGWANLEIKPEQKPEAKIESQAMAKSNPNPKAKFYGSDLSHSQFEAMWDPKQEELIRNEVQVNPLVALNELKQALISLNEDQIVERRNVIEITRVLANVKNTEGEDQTGRPLEQETPQDLLADEADRYLKPFRNPSGGPKPPQENYEHGERALQYYVMSEKNLDRLKDRLGRLGIPVIESKKQIANPPGE